MIWPALRKESTYRERDWKIRSNSEARIRGLSKVLDEYSDCRFQRSPAIIDFVEAVCQVADPKIGSGSIDEAMRRVVKMRKNHDAQRHHGAVGTKKN